MWLITHALSNDLPLSIAYHPNTSPGMVVANLPPGVTLSRVVETYISQERGRVYFYWRIFDYSHRWKNNIKIDFQEESWEGGGMDWIDLAQDRDRWRALVTAVLKLHVP